MATLSVHLGLGARVKSFSDGMDRRSASDLFPGPEPDLEGEAARLELDPGMEGAGVDSWLTDNSCVNSWSGSSTTLAVVKSEQTSLF